MSKSMLENPNASEIIKDLLDSSWDDSVRIQASNKISLLSACESYKKKAGYFNNRKNIAQKILDFYEHEAKDLPQNPMLEESVSLFLMVVLHAQLKETGSHLFIKILETESCLDFAAESKKFSASSIHAHKVHLGNASTTLMLDVNDLTAYIIDKYPDKFIDFRPDPGMGNLPLASFDDAMNLLISQGIENKNWEYLATIGKYIFENRKKYDLSKVFGKERNTHVFSTFNDWLASILMYELRKNKFAIANLEPMLEIAQQQKMLWNLMNEFLGETSLSNAIDKESVYQILVKRKFYMDSPTEDQKASYLSCHQRIFSWFYDQNNLAIIKQLYEDLCKFSSNCSGVTDWLLEVLGFAPVENRPHIDIDLFLLNELNSLLTAEISLAGIKPNIQVQQSFLEKTEHILSLARIFNKSDLYAKWMDKLDTSTYDGSRAVVSWLGITACKTVDYKIFECTFFKFKTMVFNEENKRENIHDILKALFTDHVSDNSKNAIIATLVSYPGITINKFGDSYRLVFSEKLNISVPTGKNSLFAEIMDQRKPEINKFFSKVVKQSTADTSEPEKDAGSSNQPQN